MHERADSTNARSRTGPDVVVLRIELPTGCVGEIVGGAKWSVGLRGVVRTLPGSAIGRIDAGSVPRAGAGVGQAHDHRPE